MHYSHTKMRVNSDCTPRPPPPIFITADKPPVHGDLSVVPGMLSIGSLVFIVLDL